MESCLARVVHAEKSSAPMMQWYSREGFEMQMAVNYYGTCAFALLSSNNSAGNTDRPD